MVCSSVLLVTLTLVGAAVPPIETLVPTTKLSPFTVMGVPPATGPAAGVLGDPPPK